MDVLSVNRKKENCLQKLPDMLVIMKLEVICSANKWLRKLMFTSCFL